MGFESHRVLNCIAPARCLWPPAHRLWHWYGARGRRSRRDGHGRPGMAATTRLTRSLTRSRDRASLSPAPTVLHSGTITILVDRGRRLGSDGGTGTGRLGPRVIDS